MEFRTLYNHHLGPICLTRSQLALEITDRLRPPLLSRVQLGHPDLTLPGETLSLSCKLGGILLSLSHPGQLAVKLILNLNEKREIMEITTPVKRMGTVLNSEPYVYMCAPPHACGLT